MNRGVELGSAPVRSRSANEASVRASVLVVDDIEANLLALDSLLSDMGCDVVLARSGNDALRQLLKREFALMLLDIQMPEMDGYEVAQHVRKNPATRDVPIIFLTAAHDSEASVLRGYGSGAVDFLFKPLNLPILRSKVRIFLDLYSGRREIADAKSELERANSELWQLAEAKAALAEQFKQANEELATAYRELQETQARLVQSAKMASLGELVAGVAHEINNPLSFALGHLRTVKNSLKAAQGELGELPETAQEHWLRAENRLVEMDLGLDRIRELVVKLRTFSRLDEGELKQVSMRDSVESVLTILGHRIRDRIQIETDWCTPDQLECYASALNQAIMNLVANAIDSIEGRGKLSIATRLDGETYCIAIGDTGSGIPEHLRERVLDPFFTTKPEGQGTGLGLSITYSIVRKHGGTLELRDAPGGGTLATMRIPRTQ